MLQNDLFCAGCRYSIWDPIKSEKYTELKIYKRTRSQHSRQIYNWISWTVTDNEEYFFPYYVTIIYLYFPPNSIFKSGITHQDFELRMVNGQFRQFWC